MKSKIIEIESFNREHSLVDGLKRLIMNEYHSLFKAVIAQGSVGNNEEIRYSDFDGVLVLRNQKHNQKLLSSFLKDSMQLINAYDPLQHHGWFIIGELDLKDFNPTILPLEAFEHATCIYPAEPIQLTFNVRSQVDWVTPAQRMLGSIENKIKDPDKIRGMFLLKSFLSELMLLPTLVYQAKEKKGIFKKESFEVMKGYYSAEAWLAVEVASQIREAWTYTMNWPKLFSILKNKRGLKKIVRPFLAPPIPQEISKKLTPEYFQTIHLFLKESEEIINTN